MRTPRRCRVRQKAGRTLSSLEYTVVCKKPNDAHQLISDTVAESTEALANGVSGVYNTHTFRLQCIICDSPARAFLKQVKGHAGYYSCDYCTQNGVHIGTRMTFPSLTAPLRRDYDFRTRKQEKHHTGSSPMEDLNFPMIGVRKFLILLRAMPIGHKARLSLESWNLLNDNIEQRSLALSVDFPRKCRGVVDLDRWKASELRQFLLYIGPVVLRDILHPDVPVSKLAAISGPSHLVYNIHLFSHLFNFVKLYGCLDHFSCFPYESGLGHLKHYIHGPKLPAVQLYCRLAERVGLDAVKRKPFLDDVGLRLRPSATAERHRFIHRDAVF
ncbi:hypothetical protein T265_05376 [Opisthorchis viverrini]|uniref:Uncharacterized protein n=1 Tax=Opisthorchis viverrini TaxID=6198 RepID=A0A075AFF2_OPIVI|nr:hypothetical protein T265_05376 [Opisthorchis viverrini]KER27659.1 hypothetical protein T265_05376 [Opisthorchis viverrini]